MKEMVMFTSNPQTLLDILMMAKTAWGEARNQGDDGLRSVCEVIRNRAQDSRDRWPKDIRDVCTQHLQFSCWNDNDPNKLLVNKVTFDDPQYRRAYIIAARIVLEDYLGLELTNGANHYYASSMLHPPAWAVGHQPVATVRNHIFYKL